MASAVEFALEAKCYDLNTGVGVKETSRHRRAAGGEGYGRPQAVEQWPAGRFPKVGDDRPGVTGSRRGRLVLDGEVRLGSSRLSKTNEGGVALAPGDTAAVSGAGRQGALKMRRRSVTTRSPLP